MGSRVATFHIHAVPLSFPVARVLPLGLNVTDQIAPAWPAKADAPKDVPQVYGMDPAVLAAVKNRLAARDELSAHKPRPQAPGDSMLSVQIHESALNNVLDQLHLHDRRLELTELYKEVAGRFALGRKVEPPEDLPENVFVTFAEEDPVRQSGTQFGERRWRHGAQHLRDGWDSRSHS